MKVAAHARRRRLVRSARLTGGTARVILNTPPNTCDAGRAPAAPDRERAGVAQPARAAAAIRTRACARSSPRRCCTATSRAAPSSARSSAAAQVRRPVAFSGLDLLTVLTIDLDHGLYNVDRDAVIAGAQVVYASRAASTSRASAGSPSLDTPGEIPSRMTHRDPPLRHERPGETTYRSSGQVPGFVLEPVRDVARTRATCASRRTEEPLWMNGAQQQRQRERRHRAARAGRPARRRSAGSAASGKGERIYAVRFIGDVGYLVTFRQVDPLYTLDLSDPRRRRWPAS